MHAALLFFLVFAVAASAQTARAQLVNVDVEAGVPGDQSHVGDDGPLSSVGGTLWNGIASGLDTNDLLDEFGVASDVDIAFSDSSGQTFSDPGINDLQDSGSFAFIQLLDLDPAELYELVVYVGNNGGFNLVSASGSDAFFFGDPGADGWSLPGSEAPAGDYFRVAGLEPFDTGSGVFGLEIQPDGVITGIQIRFAPEPGRLASGLLGAFAIVSLARVRKRRSGAQGT